MTEAELAGVVRDTAQGCTVAIRVQPGAKKTAIVGLYGEGAQAQLKVAVQSPPVDGRANEALIAFLADAVGTQRAAVEIVSGQSSRSKVCLVRGMARDAVIKTLAG